MIDDSLKTALEDDLGRVGGRPFRIEGSRPQSGGCINRAWLIEGSRQTYFVKCNEAAALGMFEAEAAALEALRAAEAIRVPAPVASGAAGRYSYLVLEALPLGGPKVGSWEAMGRQLADLHRHCAEHHGWQRDNVIGSTPQENGWLPDWAAFFRERRLRPQIERARANSYRLPGADQLLERVEALLEGHSPAPSLLHGDLWSGNAGFLDDGTPVIFDPATYYGDRETDLAFSEFFGGFPAEFYRAYHSAWPFPPGFEERKTLYNLYHVLNHANLFGSSYARQAKAMIEELVERT